LKSDAKNAKERKGRKVDEDGLSRVVVDAAMAIHRALGPGLLESAYAGALAIELARREVRFDREWPITASYEGHSLGVVYRADFLLEGKVLVELKSVPALDPLHTAQVLTYLRLSNLKLGMLLNFNAQLLRDGIRRVVNNL
jgi:GxxExxY protein